MRSQQLHRLSLLLSFACELAVARSVGRSVYVCSCLPLLLLLLLLLLVVVTVFFPVERVQFICLLCGYFHLPSSFSSPQLNKLFPFPYEATNCPDCGLIKISTWSPSCFYSRVRTCKPVQYTDSRSECCLTCALLLRYNTTPSSAYCNWMWFSSLIVESCCLLASGHSNSNVF